MVDSPDQLDYHFGRNVLHVLGFRLALKCEFEADDLMDTGAGVLHHQRQEAAGLVLLALEVGVEQRLVALAAAP